MKLIKEHINEKFTEDSDPIHDLGIGIKNKNFTDEKEFYNFLIDIIPSLFPNHKILENILMTQVGEQINNYHFCVIWDFLNKYQIKFENILINEYESKLYYWPHVLRDILINKGFKIS